MDIKRKVERLQDLFYKKPMEGGVMLDYTDFVCYLSDYHPKYSVEDDEALFNHATRWCSISETYALLYANRDVEDDSYYQILKQVDRGFMLPAIGAARCAFDQAFFLETQVIAKCNHFLLGVNYRPIGNSPFHVMIIPYSHTADLKHATPEHMFEFEAVLRATLRLWHEDDGHVCSYLQKHAQSGMTVPHMHAHVLCPSEQQVFRDDILRQLRYFTSLLTGQDEEAHAFLRGPLSVDTMDDIVREFKQPMQKAFEYERKVQHQFKVHRPSKLN